jgi:hypothetical protein
MFIFMLLVLQLSWGESEFLKKQLVPPVMRIWSGAASLERLYKVVDGKLVYDTIVNRDREGFRLVPDTATKKKMSHHLFFVGCSNTFGEGLSESEAFPLIVSQDLPHTRVVNLGLRGGGPSEQVYLWKHRSIKELYPEESGLMVYTVITDHLERIRQTWRYLSWASSHRPVYEVNGESVHFVGFTHESMRFKWAKILNGTFAETTWLRAVSHFNPWYLSGAREDQAILLAELKKEYLRQFPKGRFVVSWQANSMPYSLLNNDKEDFLRILAKQNIEVWVNEDPNYQDPKWRSARMIPNDGHPSALANREYGHFLLKNIRAIEKPLPR